jgi:hypothetical protein
MIVCSFTPSRIAIITSRRSKSAPAVGRTTLLGVSLGNFGYLGFSTTGAVSLPADGSGGCAPDAALALITAMSDSATPPHTARIHVVIPISPVVVVLLAVYPYFQHRQLEPKTMTVTTNTKVKMTRPYAASPSDA